MKELILSLGAMTLGFLIGRSLIEKVAPPKSDANQWQAEMLKMTAEIARRTSRYIDEDNAMAVLHI